MLIPHSPGNAWYRKLAVKTFYMSNVIAFPNVLNYLCNLSILPLQFGECSLHRLLLAIRIKMHKISAVSRMQNR